jgi:hypothetical protein
MFPATASYLFDYYSPPYPEGMLPCALDREGPFSTLSLLLWRKLVRGSLID